MHECLPKKRKRKCMREIRGESGNYKACEYMCSKLELKENHHSFTKSIKRVRKVSTYRLMKRL